jgi:hypothetical protein
VQAGRFGKQPIPPEVTDEEWLHITEVGTKKTKRQKLNYYFVEPWLENDVTKRMWVCYGKRHWTADTSEG